MRVRAPTLDRAQKRLGVGGLHEVDRPAGLPAPETRATSRPCGTAGTCTRCPPSLVGAEGREAAQAAGPVRQHDALRAPGAATREEDDVRVTLAECGLVDVRRARVRRRIREMRVRRHRRVDLLDEVRVGVVDDDETRPCVPDDLGRLVRPEPGVHRREHRAQLRQREEDRQRLERGVAPPRDPVAVTDAHSVQRVCDSIRLVVERAKGDLVVAERGRESVGRVPRRVAQHVGDQQRHQPRAVALNSTSTFRYGSSPTFTAVSTLPCFRNTVWPCSTGASM